MGSNKIHTFRMRQNRCRKARFSVYRRDGGRTSGGKENGSSNYETVAGLDRALEQLFDIKEL